MPAIEQGRMIFVRDKHDLKTEFSISLTEEGIVTFIKDEQLSKHLVQSCISFTFPLSVTFER